MAIVKENISIEGARIGFRNFSGKPSKFNAEGSRNFCVFLDQDVATALEQDGWNIRWLQSKEEGDPMQGYMQVAVNFNNIKPRIIMISSKGQTVLDEESVGLLDWAEIETVDLIIRPYNWTLHAGTKAEKSGVKAYIKSMYIKIVEDEFEKKWANAPIDDED